MTFGALLIHIGFTRLINNTVTQKYFLTTPNYCNTVLSIGRTQMANVLAPEKQVAVEVFDITGHPTAPRVYAWAHDTDDPKNPRRHVTVLHIPPVVSPLLAVRAASIQEARDARAQN
jgi:hypothetical protein